MYGDSDDIENVIVGGDSTVAGKENESIKLITSVAFRLLLFDSVRFAA
jgi:hypothetical protein